MSYIFTNADLQSVTTGTGKNLTSNTIQSSGFDNINTTVDSTILSINGLTKYYAATPGIFSAINFEDLSTQIHYKTFGSLNILDPSAGYSSNVIFAQNGPGTPYITVAGADAESPSDFVTLRQLPKFVGGLHTFESDGVTDNFTIPHTLSSVTSHSVTRNTDPNGNLIATHIDGSNIVVTFVAGPPLTDITIIVNWFAFGII